MLCTELYDDSHNDPKNFKRDMFVNDLFASTGVPLLRLLRLPVQELDHLEALVQKLTLAWQRRWKTLEANASVTA